MEWRNMEATASGTSGCTSVTDSRSSRITKVWRRQRPYITAELRKDAVDHMARLGLATSFALVVGIAEGTRVSAAKGDIKFPLRYAIYNIVPSFVGGKVSPVSVASSMASAPPLRSCLRAAAQATNLRALRTAVAGCSVISIIFQMTLAGGRGAQAYEQAIVEGREVPSMSLYCLNGVDKSGAGAVVRLCGVLGLESALAAARQDGYRTPVLPVVIAHGADRISTKSKTKSRSSASLPEGALAAVAKRSPRPCYYRIDAGKLFCRKAWRPVASKIASSTRLKGGDIVLVLEADTLSSEVPQSLLARPVDTKFEGVSDFEGGMSEHFGADEAIWGLTMLRRGLEEDEGRGDGVAGVVLAGTRLADFEESIVSIDARAALLLSVLAWAEQCAAEVAGAPDAPPPLEDQMAVKTTASCSSNGGDRNSTALNADDVPASDEPGASAKTKKSGDADSEATETDQGVVRGDIETFGILARVLGTLERVGFGVRSVVAPVGRLLFAVGRVTSAVCGWLGRKKTVTGGERSRVFLYDTDDESSFKWLAAQMLKQGWTVRRAGEHHAIPNAPKEGQEGGVPAVPVLVHRCSDEKTMTAAASHLARGVDGPQVCLVVHRLDCGVEARRLLLRGKPASLPEEAWRRGAIEVICTAEVGEDLFQFARDQLESGSTPVQVQAVLDNLLGAFYEGQELRWRTTGSSPCPPK